MALISRRNWSNFLSIYWERQSWFGSEIEAWGEEGVGDIYWVCCFDKGQRGHQARYSSAVCSFYTFLLWNVSIGAILGMWQCLQSKAEQDIGGDVCWGFREYNGLKSWHPYITGWGTGGKDGGERSGELKFMNWSNMIKRLGGVFSILKSWKSSKVSDWLHWCGALIESSPAICLTLDHVKANVRLPQNQQLEF